MKSQRVLKHNPGPDAVDGADAPVLRKSDRTRASILDAGRTLFAERGFAGATVRDVAAAAGVDPALVIRYFGSKEELFVRATQFELQLPRIDAAQRGGEAAVLVEHFFDVWERGPSASGMTILLRSAVTSESAADKMRELFAQQVLPAVALRAPRAEAQIRAALIASQLLGVALCRYLLKVPGVASATPQELVALLAPTVQRYLTGKLEAVPPAQRPS